MRKFAALFLALAFLGFDSGLAAAQDAEAAHPTVTLTGCLAQDDDDGEFELEGIESEAIDGDEIDLSAGEGVNLAPHVGHTVEITGMVITAEMASQMGEMGEMDDAAEDHPDVEDDDDDESYVYVTSMSHVAASCESD